MNTSKKKVLVVDDEPSIRDLIHDVLDDRYDVSVLSDPRMLFDHVGIYFPDLILIDMMMPGMDGDAALARLRQEGVKVPIVLYSATYTKDNISKIQRWVKILGGQGALTKPFELDELISTVDNLIAQGPI